MQRGMGDGRDKFFCFGFGVKRRGREEEEEGREKREKQSRESVLVSSQCPEVGENFFPAVLASGNGQLENHIIKYKIKKNK